MTDSAFRLEPEGNSWKLCRIGGCAFDRGKCFNCGAEETDDD